ncbi:cyclic nucleotide-binding domain-containing protein [Nocardioides humilatus]|uniref:Cyclic nucleotide-binding domain-containing protein n=1 Tax=Nocardioides humilatus TaxID=2607660 RepID=A0A5B1L683_9ACTN|nr:patatin-like phospholipase family protein [Nocardioides humilatus]KAA1415946.1 cyclic nucleotide-binding domain-containing protein [Nocardioides humilatus]
MRTIRAEPRHAVGALAGCAVFTGMPEARLEELARSMEWTVLDRGEVLMRTGDPGDDLFVVAGGRLNVSIVGADGTETIVREIGRGSTVGEVALLTGSRRTATVRAVRDTLVGRLSRASFVKLMEEDPSSALELTRVVAGWLLPGSPPRRTSAPATVALVPASGTDVREVAARLAAATPLRALDPETVDAALGEGAARSPAGSEHERALADFFDSAEVADPLILLLADPDLESSWTERVLRRADRVLVVAPGGVRPDRHARGLLARVAATTAEVPRELVVLHHRGRATTGVTELWRDAGELGRQTHVTVADDGDWQRLARHLTGRATGLVLGGGGARGFAHIGVLRALDEAGIAIDRVGGSSMGAMVGGLWSIGLEPDEIVERNREVWHEIRPLKGFTLPFVALHGSRRSRVAMAECFGDRRIEDQAREFFCTSTNLTRNRSVIHTSGPLSRYVLASMSIPGIVAPVIDHGELLVDGGVLDNLPVDPMSRTGAGRVIASDVSPPRTFSVGSHWQQEPGLVQVLRHRIRQGAGTAFPSIVRILERTATLASDRAANTQRMRSDVRFIAPPVEKYDTLDMRHLDEIVEVGYRSAVETIARWHQADDDNEED